MDSVSPVLTEAEVDSRRSGPDYRPAAPRIDDADFYATGDAGGVS